MVGHRWSIATRVFPPGSGRCRPDRPLASAAARSHRPNVPLARINEDGASEDNGDDPEGCGVRGCGVRGGTTGRRKRGEATGYITADTFAALKQTLISGGESESSPRECVCTCRAMRDVGGMGEGEGRGGQGEDGVNAQFVFRSAEKTRSLQRRAVAGADPRRRRPRVVAQSLLDSPSPSRRLYIHDDAGKYELRARCINFPLSGSRRSLISAVLCEFLLLLGRSDFSR